MPEATEEYKRRLRESLTRCTSDKPTFRRHVTDGDVAPFCGVTGDYNPYHQDETFPAKAKPSILHLQVIRLLAAVRLLPLLEPVRR